MAKQLRKKLVYVFLCLYWPTYFTLTHIPLPTWTHKAGISDKSLHFLAYFILVFLLWAAIKPYQQVNWRKATVWCILLFIVWYGVMDEWLQGYVAGRSVDIQDFFANLAGSVSSLILLTFLSFWTAALVITALGLYITTNCTTIYLARFIPFAYPVLFLCGYTFFTLLWVFYLHKYKLILMAKHTHTIGSLPWLIYSLGCPLVLLSLSQMRAHIKGRAHIPWWDILLSLMGILLVVLLTVIITQCHHRQSLSSISAPCEK